MSEQATQTEWLTVRQVAEHWNCSAQTVLNLIHEKDAARRLPAMELRGGYRIHRSAMEERQSKGVPAKAKAAPAKRRRASLPDVPDLIGDLD